MSHVTFYKSILIIDYHVLMSILIDNLSWIKCFIRFFFSEFLFEIWIMKEILKILNIFHSNWPKIEMMNESSLWKSKN